MNLLEIGGFRMPLLIVVNARGVLSAPVQGLGRATGVFNAIKNRPSVSNALGIPAVKRVQK